MILNERFRRNTLAVHKSVIKRHRQSLKRGKRNQQVKSRIRTLVRKVRSAVEGQNRQTALAELRQTGQALDKAVSKGIMKRNTASRRFSRLARSVNHLPPTP